MNNNSWELPYTSIVTKMSYDMTDDPIIVKCPWQVMALKDVGDTEIEKRELHEAQQEQLRLGIIGPAPQQYDPRSVIPMAQQKRPTEQRKVVFESQSLLSHKKNVNEVFGKKMKPNEKCHCGSGKKYKLCHGPKEALNRLI